MLTLLPILKQAASLKLRFKRQWRVNEPALSRVCRRFRADVLPIYYAEVSIARGDCPPLQQSERNAVSH